MFKSEDAIANLRKLIAAALGSSNLASSEFDETAIDRIAAMAFADPLGSALWRLRLAHNPQAFEQAKALLAHRIKHLAPAMTIRIKLAETVLREWLDTACRTCAGRGERVSDGGVKRPCGTCEGSGTRRYSDVWRMGQMGFDRKTYARWESRFAKIHDVIADADRQVAQEIRRQLEHDVERKEAVVIQFPQRRVVSHRLDEYATNEPMVATSTG